MALKGSKRSFFFSSLLQQKAVPLPFYVLEKIVFVEKKREKEEKTRKVVRTLNNVDNSFVLFPYSHEFLVIEAGFLCDVLNSFPILTSWFFVTPGGCFLLWDCVVGDSHRRGALCQHALWCYHRYALLNVLFSLQSARRVQDGAFLVC